MWLLIHVELVLYLPSGSQAVTHMEAASYCSGLGGQLATADTATKETTVAKFIEANYATNGEIFFSNLVW